MLWNVKNGVGFHVLSLIMLEGIEANKWIKSSGYSYVTEINPIVHWIIDYYDNIVIFRNFFDPWFMLNYFSFLEHCAMF